MERENEILETKAASLMLRRPIAEDQKEYAERIRKYRLSVGINQPELARAVGVTKNAVSNWEAARARPDLSTIKRLCRFFGVSADEFLGMPASSRQVIVKTVVRSKHTASDEELLTRVLALPEKERGYLLALLDSMEAKSPIASGNVTIYPDKTAFDADWVKCFSYYCAACAGEGNDLPDDDLGELIFLRKNLTPEHFDCVLPIDGDSMEPVYHSGDRVLVSKTESPAYGDDVIVFVNGACMIKEYAQEGLRPLNDEKYKLIRIHDGTTVRLFGKVVGVLTPGMLPTKDEKKSIDLFLENR